MKFSDLLGKDLGRPIEPYPLLRALDPLSDPEIVGIEYDSRRVLPGFLFVAMRGEQTDGNRFIDAAVASGAVAVVTDAPELQPKPGVAWAMVRDGRKALALVSAKFYGRPSERMHLTGVTGTNGKTTTAFLVESVFQASRRTTVLIGTVEYHVAGEVLAAPHTTPEALELNRIFAQGVERNAREGVMEVSSHALAQGRVYGLHFDVGVFTNLSQDHLDYHRDMESYFASKQLLFEGLGASPPNTAVVPAVDPYGLRLSTVARQRGSELLTFGISVGDVRAGSLELGREGSSFELETPFGQISIHSALLGRINVENMLAAAAAAQARGCSLEAIRRGLEAMRRVPGRFERVDRGQPFAVGVDYAHTEDALRNLTRVAREFVRQQEGAGRVLTVFGCGGDRDRGKRPAMGYAAGQGSDFVVLTSDNPRSEDPLEIIRQAQAGLERSGVRFAVEPDRRRAIALALHEAQPGDIVLIAGKGHERVQVLKTGAVPFDDVEVAGELLAGMPLRRGA